MEGNQNVKSNAAFLPIQVCAPGIYTTRNGHHGLRALEESQCERMRR